MVPQHAFDGLRKLKTLWVNPQSKMIFSRVVFFVFLNVNLLSKEICRKTTSNRFIPTLFCRSTKSKTCKCFLSTPFWKKNDTNYNRWIIWVDRQQSWSQWIPRIPVGRLRKCPSHQSAQQSELARISVAVLVSPSENVGPLLRLSLLPVSAELVVVFHHQWRRRTRQLVERLDYISIQWARHWPHSLGQRRNCVDGF